MDVQETPRRSFWRARGDPAVGGAHGRGEPDVGLHADPRRTEERRPSGQPVGGEFPHYSANTPERTRLAVTPPESDTASAFTQAAERGGISSGQHDARFGGCPVHAAIGV